MHCVVCISTNGDVQNTKNFTATAKFNGEIIYPSTATCCMVTGSAPFLPHTDPLARDGFGPCAAPTAPCRIFGFGPLLKALLGPRVEM